MKKLILCVAFSLMVINPCLADDPNNPLIVNYNSYETRIRDLEDKIIELEKQIGELNDKIELLIPPDQYKTYMEIIIKQDDLKWKRDFLNFTKIYKEAFKEGLLTGINLDV